MEVVYLLWHVQLITTLGRVGGGNATPAAIRSLSSEFQWAHYNISVFAPSSSWQAQGECKGTTNSIVAGFLPLLERMGNCALVLALVSVVRLLLHAIASGKLVWMVLATSRCAPAPELRAREVLEVSTHQEQTAALESGCEVCAPPEFMLSPCNGS
jgi:hypothetical protein